jgi:hypothetical protein
VACVAKTGPAGEQRVDKRLAVAGRHPWKAVGTATAIDNRLAACLLEA